MEVLEFMLETWWYASIIGFLAVLVKAKIMDGVVTVNDLIHSILFGLGGYISFFLALFLTMTIFISGIGNKKLF